ncbi:MAG: hypothetical protein JNM07_06335 [Phycisphaerae bacterium]|nr:hypothetical protein [Phycisphaerae bacterium]
MLIAGIDEAGYGPMLGPLTVALVALRVGDPRANCPPPDVWSLLERAVCRTGTDRRGRLPVNDSKMLKVGSGGGTRSTDRAKNRGRHPLVHLERTVIAFARANGHTTGNDHQLWAALGAESEWCEAHACYLGEPLALPVACSEDQVRVGASGLTGVMRDAGVRPALFRCRVQTEPAFNRLVRAEGSKAGTTGSAVAAHLRSVWDALESGERAWVVCDRLGGRTYYGPWLAEVFMAGCGCTLTCVARAESSSDYLVESADSRSDGRSMRIRFQTRADSRDFCVALASMIAKYARELAMIRFNTFWCARLPELKPTAGYHEDAVRWLADAASILSESDRSALVRIA